MPSSNDAGEEHDVGPEAIDCTSAPDGRACGGDRHCVAGRCLHNVCGDGVRAGGEECDDGNAILQDGCNPGCRLEPGFCPDGRRVELGESCDPTTPVENDAGIEPLPEPVCPRVTSLEALPPEGHSRKFIFIVATLEDDEGAATYWYFSHGSGERPSRKAVSFRCGGQGQEVVYYVVAKPGCPTTYHELTVTCLPAPELPDAGIVIPTTDAGPSDAGPNDASISDAALDASLDAGMDAGLDGGVEDAGVDASPEPDTDGSMPPPTGLALLPDGCVECLEANCGETYDLDLVSPCFYEATSPAFSQACIDAHVCSTLSADECARDAILGPIGCYCGIGVEPSDCRQGLVNGNCVAEWERATGCATGDSVCTFDRFGDSELPSGIAKFNLECQNQLCASVCF